LVVVEAAVKFGPLRIGKRDRRTVRGDAVPDFLNQRQTLFYSEPVDPERLHGCAHGLPRLRIEDNQL